MLGPLFPEKPERRHWYVNQQTGSDRNTGLSEDEPFKTWDKAMAMSKECDIIHMRGPCYKFDKPIKVTKPGIKVTGY